MTHIESLASSAAQATESAASARALRQQRLTAPSTDNAATRSDSVEISSVAANLAGAAEQGFRPDLVKRIREQIESGAYDVDSRLDLAAERLQRDLNA